MTAQLLSPDCSNPQGALLDTLTLADAVICTLGTVEVQGMMEPADILEESTGSLAVKIPCSKLKTLIESLTEIILMCVTCVSPILRFLKITE